MVRVFSLFTKKQPKRANPNYFSDKTVSSVSLFKVQTSHRPIWRNYRFFFYHELPFIINSFYPSKRRFWMKKVFERKYNFGTFSYLQQNFFGFVVKVFSSLLKTVLYTLLVYRNFSVRNTFFNSFSKFSRYFWELGWKIFSTLSEHFSAGLSAFLVSRRTFRGEIKLSEGIKIFLHLTGV